MGLFAFLGGRHNLRAWGQALFAAGCRLPSQPDRKRYEKLTEQMIEADCKTIQECAQKLPNLKSADSRSKRRMTMYSRLEHLSILEPYATAQQRRTIRKAKTMAAKCRKYK